MSDRICLRLGRRDMNTFRTVEREGKLPVVHVAGRLECALCPVCARPSATTNGTGWRDVIDVYSPETARRSRVWPTAPTGSGRRRPRRRVG